MSKYTYSDELFSDLHKDAYGFRPGHDGFVLWESLSADQKQAKWDAMIDTMNEEERLRIRSEERRGLEFIAQMNDAITKTPGLTPKLYVIEQMEINNALDDPDFLCFKLGLKYGFFQDMLK